MKFKALTYRADIDGLRAIAVSSVIFFHVGIPGFSGGFVGVDIFFVISGFLITSIILKEIHAGTFSIARFYERRIRRIFPALFPLITFTVVFGAFLFDPIAFKAFGQTIIATTFFGSNILFWQESGYFDAASITKPLLHTWSLAVEEQFYILFPLLLIAINRFFKNRYITWLLGICLISLLANIYGVYTHPSATFYLVFTRAWELLFGSILAIGVLPKLKLDFHRNLFSIAGICFIVYSVGFYTEATLFPGAAALTPVLGASLVIYSGIGGGKSTISKILSIKPVVYIGLISYSLYLWHWPLIVFVRYLICRELTSVEITAIILATLLISSLSLKFIEQPFRGLEPVIPDKKKLFVLSGVLMVIVSIIGTFIYLQNGMPYRYPDAKSAIMDMETDPQWMHFEENEINLDGLQKGKQPALIGKWRAPCFALWGDSHAGGLITALSEMSQKYGISGYNITHGKKFLPILGLDRVRSDYNLHEAQYNQNVIDFIKARPEISTVIIAGYWSAESKYVDVTGEYNGKKTYSTFLKQGLLRSVDAVLKMGRKVVLVTDVPTLRDGPNAIIYVAKRFNKTPNFQKISPSIAEYEKQNKDVLLIFNEIAKFQSVTIVHPESMLFDHNGNTIVMANEKSLYMDTDHLSTEGSRFISPVFDQVFKTMVMIK